MRYLLLFFLFIPVFPLRAEANDEAWEIYMKAHKEAQVAFHHEVRLSLHELRDTIARSQEMKLAMADQKSARFYYLSENYPARIDRTHGFAAFINFEWTDEDEKSLLKISKEYRSRKKKIEKIQKKLEKNDDFKKVLEQLDDISGSLEYERIRNRFRFMPEEVEALLNA